MASQGPLGPLTTVDDSSVGTQYWGTPNNAQVSDAIYTTATLLGGSGAVGENSIKIVQGGTISGTDKSTGAALSLNTEAYTSYGSSSDLWGLNWLYTDINSSTFGVAVAYNGNTATSHYLKATNFGFSIPNSRVDGILAEVQAHYQTPGGDRVAGIDYVRITVTYTPAGLTNIVSVSNISTLTF